MTNLSVNLNKVALLRNSRNLEIPSVIDAANTCIKAGVHISPSIHVQISDTSSP
ncbi:MAG: pyridoxine 5'-phosphate synthase [Gloeocapsa sp. UFS-A4-WI-NPMV-4B04]|nr:pyridoxine 5'-phosphate synthase [Gloeocapsa sp. UFS-A4-WI-NPMV-4B04]